MPVQENAKAAEPGMAEGGGIGVRDVGLLVGICALLLGWGAICGRPLSMHEARLPELAREMVLGRSDWLLPLSGGRPWLERPPLPHWFTAGSMVLFGRTEPEWVSRVPAAGMGTVIVLLGAWMAGKWFGRSMGLLAGVVLATTYELYDYSSLAEDDIYLAAVAVGAMAAFVRAEWGSRKAAGGECAPSWAGRPCYVFGWRPWPVVLMFFLLGLTNWVKGPLVGAAPVIGAIGVYLLWNWDWEQIQQHHWIWGWVIFVGLTVAWPLWALHKYPDVWDNWKYDYTGIKGAEHDPEYEHAAWYYLAMMPMILAPWVWAVPVGMWATAKRAWRGRGSGERLVWCWAVVGLMVLSLPARKHHHYFLPVVVPWGILAALGLREVGRWMFLGKGPEWTRWPLTGLVMVGVPGVVAIVLLRKKIAGPDVMPAILAGTWLVCVWVFYAGQQRKSGWVMMGAVLAGYVVVAGWLQAYVVSRDKTMVKELAFLREVGARVPAGNLLALNAAGTELEFFRLQYYLPDRAVLLHNLSFLRSDQIRDPAVWVVARAREEQRLGQLGDVQVVLTSEGSYGEKTPMDRFTLFRVTYAPWALRAPLPKYVGVMQAMERKKGPWCGGDW